MTDLTFITNENGESLLRRFSELIRDTKYFDCLVGYFYSSGFHSMYRFMESTEKIRVLIGISTDKRTFGLIEESRKHFPLSSTEIKEDLSDQLVKEMENAKDSTVVEDGIRKFIEWLRSGKLEIRAFPAERLHAKLYIMTFKEGHIDSGRVITGSSNFTQAGLEENLEFNVELKNSSDYKFAENKFNELWKKSVDVSEKYVETIENQTWLNDTIDPYNLYLKFLYEYLKEKINIDKDDIDKIYFPENFMNLQYQHDAVLDAKTKLNEYGGVFLADVVGLGKTYIAAILAQQLDGKNLVIAPPTLLNKDNPGSWPNVFYDFGIRQTKFESIGKLDTIIDRGTEEYKNVFIDEAHRFRTEQSQMYENLFQICRGKRVILISATPLNNTPMDILSQIKLFQNAHKSTLPSPKVRDLERYFKTLQNKLKDVDRQKDRDEYIRIVKENAEEIRVNILQYLMVRRTRSSIIRYYAEDFERHKFKFPEVEDPKPLIYNFDQRLDRIFNKTLNLITKNFKYSRYTPLLYLKEDISQPEALSQKNMSKFMKILLLKRLESSFFAFKQTVRRFIESYTNFIKEYKNGNVYVSKKYINKIFELLEDYDEDAIQKLIEDKKAEKFKAEDFHHEFLNDLNNDLHMLQTIDDIWKDVESDPKLDKFIDVLNNDAILKENKIIVFTESKETADYLGNKLNSQFKNKVLIFSSASNEDTRIDVIQNFDPHSRHNNDDYRILVCTEILSEGVNLHRANVVINYDIPWNPTRMMQRVGRINRVDTKFDKIYTYNFFPAGPINENISLTEAAEAKIKSFIEMLGNDSRLLTDEEIKSHDLFKKLTSKTLLTGEDEVESSELEYLALLRDIRDNNKDLFEKIKRIPKKARTTRISDFNNGSVVTFFRKGKLRKIFITDGKSTNELDFFKAANILKAQPSTKREKPNDDFYKYLDLNKQEFEKVFTNEADGIILSGGRSYETKFLRIIKAIINHTIFTDDDEEYLLHILDLLQEGAIPKQTIKKILKDIELERNPLKILSKIRSGVPSTLFQKPISWNAADTLGPKEVILSEQLIGGK